MKDNINVVVRSNLSGVWHGRLVNSTVHPFGINSTVHPFGIRVELADARRAWDWEGAQECAELATKGPTGGHICGPVETAIIGGDIIEILSSTPEADARWHSFGK